MPPFIAEQDAPVGAPAQFHLMRATPFCCREYTTNGRRPKTLDCGTSEYFEMKNNVIKAERRVLKELGFCVHVKHPHKLIITCVVRGRVICITATGLLSAVVGWRGRSFTCRGLAWACHGLVRALVRLLWAGVF